MTHKVGHNDGTEDWDWDIQQAVNIAIAEGQIPELEDTVPKPDYIKEGSDGLYYFFYTVKASELAGLQNDITVFYTSTSSYKMDITPGSADADKASAISFGAIEEVDAKFRGYNPLDILKIWQGGMSFHGGLIGIIFTSIIFARKNNQNSFLYMDIVALVAPIGIFFGRVANFINAELWGRPTDVFWGVVFPGDLAQQCVEEIRPCARHPSQLYEAALEGLALFIILNLIVFQKRTEKGLIGSLFLRGFQRS